MKQNVRFLVVQTMLCLLTAYLFFRSVWSLVFLIPFYLLNFRRVKQMWKQQKRQEFAVQFRDGLQCLLASLEAGYSIENSFVNAADDLLVMFSADAPIVRQFVQIRSQLSNGANIEELVLAMGEDSGVEDVRNFASIFVTAKRTGGDLIGVIRSTAATLYQKQEIQREIATVLLAKQVEVNVMKAMPYGMLIYFQLFSPEFLKPLYTGVTGRIVMLIVFALYIGCCRVAEHLAWIDV